MTASEALAATIRRALDDAADPSIAPAQQAYMKSETPFLGVRVPTVRALTRRAAAAEDDAAVLQDAALLLWRSARYREERYAALALMGAPPLRGDPATLPVHEEMIRSGAWWDFTDEATHRLRELLDANPGPLSVEMRVWADDPDPWIRRAAIICQLGRGEHTDKDLLADVILSNVDDAGLFIRKAIGWALRDAGRTDPEWVRTFAAQHPLSPLSRREALRRLG